MSINPSTHASSANKHRSIDECFTSFIVRYTLSQESDFPKYYFEVRDPSPIHGCRWIVVEANQGKADHDPTIFALLLEAFHAGSSVELALGRIEEQFSSQPFGPQKGDKVASLSAISLAFNF